MSISVVGTRSLSEYGRQSAYKIGYELAAAGAVVVSGLALGIDSVAACGALEHHSRFICRRARLGENQQLSITPLENETGAVIYLAASIIDDSSANDSGNANER